MVSFEKFLEKRSFGLQDVIEGHIPNIWEDEQTLQEFEAENPLSIRTKDLGEWVWQNILEQNKENVGWQNLLDYKKEGYHTILQFAVFVSENEDLVWEIAFSCLGAVEIKKRLELL